MWSDSITFSFHLSLKDDKMLPNSCLVIFVALAATDYLSFVHIVDCQEGITIQIGDRIIPNHGLVTIKDIFIDPTGTAISQTVSCRTTLERCCIDFGPPNDYTRMGRVRSGDSGWLFPRDGYRNIPRQVDQPTFLIGIRRDNTTTHSVNLFRNMEGTNNQHDGIWTCTIYDANNRAQEVFVGIYDNNTANYGVLSAPSSMMEYNELSADPVRFNLTFDVTDGPATTVTWTRDGVEISPNNTFATYRVILQRLDSDRYGTSNSRYSNILTVNGRITGEYGVSVSNVRTSPPVAAMNATILDFRHPTVMAPVRSEGLTAIRVTWISQLGQQEAGLFNDYTIRYTCSPNCDDGGPMTTTDTEFTLSNVAQFATYTFTVTSNFDSVSPPMHVLPIPAATDFGIETPGVLVPVIAPPQTGQVGATSVSLSWTQPPGGVTVNDYVVSYRRINGTGGQCSSFQDTTRTVERQGVTNADVTNLEEFSIYEFSITGNRGGLSNRSDTLLVETNAAAPSRAPQNFDAISRTNTTVILSWDSVECIHRNGLITLYLLSYRPVGKSITCATDINVRVNSSNPEEGGSFVATGLEPATEYEFEVAAVNDAGTGTTGSVQMTTLNPDGSIYSDSESEQCVPSSEVTTAAVTSAVVCSVVFYIGGVISGLLIYLAVITKCVGKCKQVSTAKRGTSETLNAAPLYEDVPSELDTKKTGVEFLPMISKEVPTAKSGKSAQATDTAALYEEVEQMPVIVRERAGIKLQENVAYGPVRQ